MWVKICATTSLPDALLAVEAGADAVGFVFAPSKRRVDAESVGQITRLLPPSIEKAGVFHAVDTDEIVRTVRTAGLTLAQLHFAYDASLAAELTSRLGPEIKLLQVVSCSVEQVDEASLKADLAPLLVDGNLWGILLDAATQGSSGGTGKSFAWDKAAAVIDAVWPTRSTLASPRLIIAGGLHSQNVREAISRLHPFGVDVASGVEASPGQKDPDKLKAFVEEAKAAEPDKTAKPTAEVGPGRNYDLT